MKTVCVGRTPENRYTFDAACIYALNIIMLCTVCTRACAHIGNMIVASSKVSHRRINCEYIKWKSERISLFRGDRTRWVPSKIQYATNVKKRNDTRVLTTCYVTDVLPNAAGMFRECIMQRIGARMFWARRSLVSVALRASNTSEMERQHDFPICCWYFVSFSGHFVRTSFANEYVLNPCAD